MKYLDIKRDGEPAHLGSRRYLTYPDERGRPFVELVARIAATDPATVVDLGCGPGNLTRLLKERWPDATVTGLESSPEMIARAKAIDGIDFAVADLREWVVTTARPAMRRSTYRLERHPPVGPRPPRTAAGAGGPDQAGWLVRLPGARQLRRTVPHDSQGTGG